MSEPINIDPTFENELIQLNEMATIQLGPDYPKMFPEIVTEVMEYLDEEYRYNHRNRTLAIDQGTYNFAVSAEEKRLEDNFQDLHSIPGDQIHIDNHTLMLDDKINSFILHSRLRESISAANNLYKLCNAILESGVDFVEIYGLLESDPYSFIKNFQYAVGFRCASETSVLDVITIELTKSDLKHFEKHVYKVYFDLGGKLRGFSFYTSGNENTHKDDEFHCHPVQTILFLDVPESEDVKKDVLVDQKAIGPNFRVITTGDSSHIAGYAYLREGLECFKFAAEAVLSSQTQDSA